MRFPAASRLPSVALATVLAAGALCAFAAPALAGDEAPRPAAGDDARIEEARRRWDSLPEEKRERLVRLFREFKEMPQEKRDALRERFSRLGGVEGVKALKDDIERLRDRSPERLEMLRRKSAIARRLQERAVEALSPDLLRRLGGLAPEEREVLRRRVLHSAGDGIRRALIAAHATEDERRILDTEDDPARGETMHAVMRRARDAILEPHRAELTPLSPEERAAEMDRIFVDEAWKLIEPRLPEVSREIDRLLRLTPEERKADMAERLLRHADGMGHGQKIPGGARRIVGTLMLVPPENRADAKEALREGMEGLAGLPEEEARAAFESLLRRILVDYGGPADGGRRKRQR